MDPARYGFRYFCKPLHRVLFIFRSLYILHYRSRVEIFRLGRNTPPIHQSAHTSGSTPESGQGTELCLSSLPCSRGSVTIPLFGFCSRSPQGLLPFRDHDWSFFGTPNNFWNCATIPPRGICHSRQTWIVGKVNEPRDRERVFQNPSPPTPQQPSTVSSSLQTKAGSLSF